MNSVLIVLCLELIFLQCGYGISCYHCHQTSKECNSGYLDYKNQRNCSEEKCTVMQYETPMPGRKVLATIRDCSYFNKSKFLEMVSEELEKPAKIILYKECNTSLCNSSITKYLFKTNPLGTMVLLVFLAR